MKEDLEVLEGMLESGAVAPVIEERYELADAAEALERIGAGHIASKLVLTT